MDTEVHPVFGLYGLRCGQIRGSERRVHNGVWFNLQWQKIGWGDLSDDDFVKVSKKIPFGELFIVLSEHASLPHTTPMTPVYGTRHCSRLIEHGCIHEVLMYSLDPADEMIGDLRGVRFRRVTRQTAIKVINRLTRLYQSQPSIGRP